MPDFKHVLTDNWSLFLDRDGVINKRIPDNYVMTPDQFIFLPGVLDALEIFNRIFKRIIVVTNQQGIGRGLMRTTDLQKVHDYMLSRVKSSNGRIDRIYYSPDLKNLRSFWRKPSVGMGLAARKEFPDIRFKKSIMTGDTTTDMLFGKRLGMTTVFIGDDLKEKIASGELIDYSYPDLISFANSIC